MQANNQGLNFLRSQQLAGITFPVWILTFLVILPGCEGVQSTLAPAGKGAEQIATLFWWMAGGAVVIWTVVIGLAIYALGLNPAEHRRKQSAIWIIGGGAIAPTVILSVLLIYGLSLLSPLLAKPPEGTLQIEVEGRQWWWRVRYRQAEGESIELANEIRLPIGEPVEFVLSSGDVVHSFWIPVLGGKVDMLPGRTTRLTLEPTKLGTYRGVCAEYCGTSHALMNFSVVVLKKDEFESWRNHQKSSAYQSNEELAIRGQELFLNSGCGACHSVRGSPADGRIGPDLTHVGSRNGLAADVLSNDPESYRNWIAHTKSLKPDVLMPEFNNFSDEELSALAVYLDSLE